MQISYEREEFLKFSCTETNSAAFGVLIQRQKALGTARARLKVSGLQCEFSGLIFFLLTRHWFAGKTFDLLFPHFCVTAFLNVC